MTDPVTEIIKVTYSGGVFIFADANGSDISGGDLSAYPGANSFTFQPAAGQVWKFYSAKLTATAQKGGIASMGLNDDFSLQIASLGNARTQIVIYDNNRETVEQEYEYAFQIQLPDGTIVDCDPKIYNRIG